MYVCTCVRVGLGHVQVHTPSPPDQNLHFPSGKTRDENNALADAAVPFRLRCHLDRDHIKAVGKL